MGLNGFFFPNHLPNYFFNSFILLAFATSCGREFHNLIMCYVNKHFLLTLDALRILYLYFFFTFFKISFYFYADAHAPEANCLETLFFRLYLSALWIRNGPFDVGISKYVNYKPHIKSWLHLEAWKKCVSSRAPFLFLSHSFRVWVLD